MGFQYPMFFAVPTPSTWGTVDIGFEALDLGNATERNEFIAQTAGLYRFTYYADLSFAYSHSPTTSPTRCARASRSPTRRVRRFRGP